MTALWYDELCTVFFRILQNIIYTENVYFWISWLFIMWSFKETSKLCFVAFLITNYSEILEKYCFKTGFKLLLMSLFCQKVYITVFVIFYSQFQFIFITASKRSKGVRVQDKYWFLRRIAFEFQIGLSGCFVI